MPLNVLLLDGDRAHRSELAAALRKADIEVIAEADGPHDALELIAQQPVDIAVIDIGSAGTDPVHFARELRTIAGKGTLLVAVASSTHAKRVAELVAAGAMGYVVKENVGRRSFRASRNASCHQCYCRAEG